MFTKRLITQGQLFLDAFVDRSRDANTTSLSQLFYRSRDIDPVALDPISLFNYVPQVDTDPKFHPAVIRQIKIINLEFFLHFHRTTHHIHHTGKLSQYVVSRRVHNPASMLLDKACHRLSIGLQGLDGDAFIVAHEPTVTFDIGTEDGRELSLNLVGGYGTTP